MTIILVAANADQITLVSDRRLSWHGKPVTEDFGKAGHLLCADVSAVYGFTGLATIGKFNTSDWLTDAFFEASKKDSRFFELIHHFAELAGKKFRTDKHILSIPEADRRLTVMLTGYTAAGEIVNVLISNYQDFINFIDYPTANSDFSVSVEDPVTLATDPSNQILIQAVGAFRAFRDPKNNEEDIPAVGEIRELLEKRAPHEAIQQKMAAVVTKISDSARAGGTVGKRLNIARLDFRAPLQAYAWYITDTVESKIHLINYVDGRYQGRQLMVRDVQISAGEPIAFPQVYKNQNCSCGSAKKYKHCHGAKRW